MPSKRFRFRPYVDVPRAAGAAYGAYSGYKRGRSIGRSVGAFAHVASSSYKRFRRGSTTGEPGPVTGDRDARLIYRRKRFPRGRKKRWISFKKKVRHIQFKDLPPSFALYSYGGAFGSLDGKQAGNDYFTVLGMHGGADVANDLGKLWSLVPGAGGDSTVRYTSTLRVTGYIAE